jgi:hypothetical protein
MEIKVKAVDSEEPKSTQQIEAELLQKHEEKYADSDSEETTVETINTSESTENETVQAEPVNEINEEAEEILETTSTELSEEQVLSYIKKRYDKDISSFDELLAERKANDDIPEDVANFLKYKNETGRGIQDYVKLQQNFDEMPDEDLLRNFYKITEDGLDSEDIDFLLEEFQYDDEVDEKSEIRKKKVAKKKAISQAKAYFRKQQDAYKQPLESRGTANLTENEDYKKLMEWYDSAMQQNDVAKVQRDKFLQRTNELFTQEFKGFKFKIGDKDILYTVQSPSEMRNKQSEIREFVNQHTDKNGEIVNINEYHKGMALAMNPDKFAEFFYEQGKAEATEDVMRKTKNIKMSTRNTPEVVSKGGMKIKSLNDSSGRGLKIRSLKKK